MTRVLVVDDSEPTRDVMRDVLEMAGCAIMEADSAESALALLGQHRFEALVTDIFLPGHNGIWLIREVRASGAAGRVVSVSGGGSIGGMDALEAARIAGADSVLKKPFSAAALIEAVRGAATAHVRAVAD
jgi:CheY-like chemotaxis protein